MSMLAGPRQKKEYRLLPKGKPLYEDENNFGTRMLQKMGWSKGKGLGANEDGNQEFIRVKYKDDANGLGFKDRDDGWTQHKTEFETLLKSLNNSLENSDEEQDLPAGGGFGFQNEGSKKQESAVPKLSGESLEEKSKKSRARVHYKKFTRGKDLSQYSEKDLANIFGKKTLDISKEEPQKVKEEVEEKAEDEERVFGVQLVSTGTSINDYFKNKMALLKSGRKQNDTCSESQNRSEDNALGIENSVPENLSSKKIKYSIEEAENTGNDFQVGDLNSTPDRDPQTDEVPKLKKKKNKQKVIEEIVEKTSKKKNKNVNVIETNATEFMEEEASGDTFKKKSKKKKANLDEETSRQMEFETSKLREPFKDNEASEEIEKKSKKKKRKLEEELTNVESTENKSKKKRKNLDDPTSPEAEPVASKSKKSKKGNLQQSTIEDATTVEESKIVQNSEQKSEIFTGNSNEPDKPKKNKKCKKELKESEPSQSNSKIENLKATSTVSENEINSTTSCTYKINSFVAEVFRHTDIGGFVGSNLSEIVGYTLSEDVTLEVTAASADGIRIYDMWQDAICKYQKFEKQQRLQSENGQEATEEGNPSKKVYKNNRRKKSWSKNIFRVV